MDPRVAVMQSVFDGWKARDFDALLKATDPAIFAELALPPGEGTQTYEGRDEIAALLRDGDESYEHFEAEPRTYAVGPTGRVFAEGSVSYRRRGSGGMASMAFWVCEVREGKIVHWESFSDRDRALSAAGFDPAVGLPRDSSTPE